MTAVNNLKEIYYESLTIIECKLLWKFHFYFDYG